MAHCKVRKYLNRTDHRMNSKVNSSILPLTSSVGFLSPYSKYSISTLLRRVLIWTNDRNSSETPAKNLVVEFQMKDKAAKSAPYLDYRLRTAG